MTDDDQAKREDRRSRVKDAERLDRIRSLSEFPGIGSNASVAFLLDHIDTLTTELDELRAILRSLDDDGIRPPHASYGVRLIAAERQRQIMQEGWTPEHDDGHTRHQLADAAIAYIIEAITTIPDPEGYPPDVWPWGLSKWRPSGDPIRNLLKAGALVAAEIDRLQRKKTDTPVGPDGAA